MQRAPAAKSPRWGTAHNQHAARHILREPGRGPFPPIRPPALTTAHFIQEKLSLRRECDTAWAALHQVHADLIFQVLHLPAQCGLGHPKLRRGLGEVQGFAHVQEISQLTELHSFSCIMPKKHGSVTHLVFPERRPGAVGFSHERVTGSERAKSGWARKTGLDEAGPEAAGWH